MAALSISFSWHLWYSIIVDKEKQSRRDCISALEVCFSTEIYERRTIMGLFERIAQGLLFLGELDAAGVVYVIGKLLGCFFGC